MDFKTLGGVAILGTLAAAWGQVKMFLNNIRNLFVVTHVIENGINSRFLMEWLDNNITFVNLGSRTYITVHFWGSDRRNTPIAVWNRMLGTHLAFYKKRVPVVIAFDHYGKIRFTYAKGMFPIEDVCKELVRAVEDKMRTETDTTGGSGFWLRHVWGELSAPLFSKSRAEGLVAASDEAIDTPPSGDTPNGGNPDLRDLVNIPSLQHKVFMPVAGDIRGLIDKSENELLTSADHQRDRWLTRMYLTPEQLAVIDEIRFWMRSRDWYKKRGIPWRRSILLHGDPGTGKSSLAYAIGVALNSPVYIYHLDTMTDKNLVAEWGSGGNTAKIRLLEDFDTIFTGRKNNFLTDMNNALSFDCLLNVLDGVVVAEGSLTIITTNHLDAIDPALVRPGRVDTKVAFGPLGIDGKLHIGRTLLPDMPEEELKAFFNKTLPNPAVGAVVQEECIKHALKLYWEAQPK